MRIHTYTYTHITHTCTHTCLHTNTSINKKSTQTLTQTHTEREKHTHPCTFSVMAIVVENEICDPTLKPFGFYFAVIFSGKTMCPSFLFPPTDKRLGRMDSLALGKQLVFEKRR